MSHFEGPAFFGEIWAHDYGGDGTWGADPGEVEFLADLAGNGRALELAIGTGRVGLPLAARGVPVEGIEASEKMVAKLRAKPGGEQIPVTIADMADVPVEGPFRLAYLIFNTLFNLIDVNRQAECLRNVARVLEPGRAFVVECPVSDQRRRDGGRHLEVLEVTEDSATIEVSDFDAATQHSRTQKITFTDAGVRLRPHSEGYTWPDELDQMAAAAGLRLGERYADWHRQPFGPESSAHISVYRPA
jgi:SAM-dependent methyltransferase